MNRQQILFNMFYDMLQTPSHVAQVAPDKTAVAMRSPGRPLWLWVRPDWTKAKLRSFFTQYLKAHAGSLLPGLVAIHEAALLCADLYAAETRCAYTARGLNAYYLPEDAPCPATDLPLAAAGDAARLCDWISHFYQEALHSHPVLDEHKNLPTPPRGCLYVLRDADNASPLAMGMLCGNPQAPTRRLNLIYTPPALRRRGYGKTVTAALCAIARESKSIPVLYTAADNIAANQLYRSLGFLEAGRLTEIQFEN